MKKMRGDIFLLTDPQIQLDFKRFEKVKQLMNQIIFSL